MNPRDKTQPRDAWHIRHGVTCPGCRPGEWYGIPRHEPSCPCGPSWYVVPSAQTPTVRLLCNLAYTLDPGLTPSSPSAYDDRRALVAMNYLIHAAWHLAAKG